MDYLGTTLIAKWFAREGSPRRPAEASPALCLFLANLYEACAQSCAVIKTLHKAGYKDGQGGGSIPVSPSVVGTGQTSPSFELPPPPGPPPPFAVLTKLCKAVHERCIVALDQLHADAEAPVRLGSGLLEFISYFREIHLALAHLFQGQAARATDDCGLVIGQLNKAKVLHICIHK